MTLFVVFFLSLSLSAEGTRCIAQTDNVEAPTELKQKWLDAITVELSWKRPSSLLSSPNVCYCLQLLGKEQPLIVHTITPSFKEKLLTQEMVSDHWTVKVWIPNVNKSVQPYTATLNFPHNKQKAELVKDFKCFYNVENLDCSWIPVNPSLNLTVSYRNCDILDKHINSVKTCKRTHMTGNPEKHRCIMRNDEKESENTCIFVETETELSSFKVPLAINPPHLNVTEENGILTVTLKPPLPDKRQCMLFEVCHKRCNVQKECHNTTYGVFQINFTYDKRCRYEFQAKTIFSERCLKPSIVSKMSDPVHYGFNDRTLAIASIIISIFLSVCIILLCYCFRKHKNFFWPNIPDASILFKQVMNGNDDAMTTGGNLYMPVPETIDPCKIRLVPESYIK